VRSNSFTIPRIIFSRLTAELYVRRFWFLLVPWPCLAVILITLSRDPNVTVFAFLVGVWPLTIPLRAYLFSSKAAELVASPVWVSIEGDWVLFHSEDGKGMKIARSRIDAVTELHGHLAIVVGYVKFAFVPVSAFDSAADAEKFKQALTD
jgi:hypothetical protein